MFNKRKSSFKTLLIITAVAFLSFNDIETFISNFTAKGDGESQVDFKEGEIVSILKEKAKIKHSSLIDEPNGNVIKALDTGEEVELIRLFGKYRFSL